jgi:formamidopyrimidine-DNA glycosylase
MPELPEVETTVRGISPHMLKQTISSVIVRHPLLRWPIPADIDSILRGKIIKTISRRGKYILFGFETGTLILHLGMSGRVRILDKPTSPEKHDHVDICLNNQSYLRLSDPRRFGALLWTASPAEIHPLLSKMGIEPLLKEFNGDYLFQLSRKKKTPVKSFIMDSHIVTGVGNIYATEALFHASIYPNKPAGNISKLDYISLVRAIKLILKNAIAKGGTTLKDFKQSDGNPGYFSIQLKVYGKNGEPCPRCNMKLKSLRIAQRSTIYCSMCQK